MREWNTNALICLRGDLKLKANVRKSGMLDMLAIPTPLGFLNQHEMKNIKALNDDMEQMEMIIDFLLGKEDKCFGNFCEILTQSNNGSLATSLNKKAEELRRGSGNPHPMHPCTNICPLLNIYVYGCVVSAPRRYEHLHAFNQQ